MRCKATPDMSLRFLDESFAKENATIADIQRRMMEWYTARETALSKGGLTALSNTMACAPPRSRAPTGCRGACDFLCSSACLRLAL